MNASDSPQDYPRVDVVIPHFNHLEETVACYASLLRQRVSPARILIIDNGSTTHTVQALQDACPQARVTRLADNLGFAAAVNVGLKLALQDASTTHCWVLNNDTRCPPDTLDGLLKAIAAAPDNGLAGCPMVEHRDHGHNVLVAPGKNMMRPFMLPVAARPDDLPEYLSGACLLLRRDMIEQVGLLDDGFFFFFEDADYGRRAQLAGWRLALARDVQIEHAGSHTISRMSGPKAEFYRAGHVRYLRKHTRGAWWRGVLPFTLRLLIDTMHGRFAAIAGSRRGWAKGFAQPLPPRQKTDKEPPMNKHLAPSLLALAVVLSCACTNETQAGSTPDPAWAHVPVAFHPQQDSEAAPREIRAVPSASAPELAAHANARVIHLASGLVDTSKTGPDGWLRQDTPDAQTLFTRLVNASLTDGRMPFMVQWSGPISAADHAMLRTLGITPRDYLPPNSLILLLDPNQLNALRQASTVRWIGELLPAYKEEPSLAQKRLQVNLAEASPVVSVNLQVLDPDRVELLADEIKRAGGTVWKTHTGRRWGHVRADVPVASIPTLSALPLVSWIEEFRAPKLLNDLAATAPHMNAETVWNVHGLTGEGQIIGHADTGLDLGNTNLIHPDFLGKIVYARGLAKGILGRGGLWDDPDGHGTHTAGSILGSGAASTGQFKGIAFDAKIVHQSLIDRLGLLTGIPSDLNLLYHETYTNGARIHSDSWGASGAGLYDLTSQQSDEYMWDYDDMLLVFAAGNEGIDANADGIIDGNSIGSPSTAKSLLCIGAAESERPPGTGGYSGEKYGDAWPADYPANPIASDYMSFGANSNQGMAAFSSRGPCADGRTKPDLVAPGTDIVSTRSRHGKAGAAWGLYAANSNYMFSGGTSMATPLAAGAAGLVRQYLVETRGFASPSAALMKGLMINGAVSLTPGQYDTGATREIPPLPRPNNVEGWGQVNVEQALFPAGVSLYLFDRELLSTDGTNHYEISVSGTNTLSVTLCYSDYPGSLTAGKMLVNDLDLIVIGPSGVTNRPNGLTAPDRLNNVEGIDLTNPAAGTYRIRVIGYNVPFGPQPYALIVRGNVQANNAGLLSFAVSGVNAAESAGELDITVTRQDGSDGAVTVDFETIADSAQAGSDYVATNGTLTFADGVISNSFRIDLLGDSLTEMSENFSVILKNPTGGATLIAPTNILVTINDDDLAGLFTFSSAEYHADENAGAAAITVLRNGGASGEVSVSFAATNGIDVISGVDFIPTNGILVFADGVTSQVFTVQLLDDEELDPGETVQATLTSPTGGAAIGTPATTTLFIDDDDSIYETVLDEDFNSGVLPSGWTVVVNGDAGAEWRFDDPSGRGNLTGGDGAFAIADSDFAGELNMDTELRTPSLDLSGYTNVIMEMKLDFWWFSGGSNEIINLDISTNGFIGPWSALASISGRSVRGPLTIQTNVTGRAAGSSNAVFRMRYYQAHYDWWLQVDDVRVFGQASGVSAHGNLRFAEISQTVSESATQALVTVRRTGGSVGAVSVDYRTTGGGNATAGQDYVAASGTVHFADGVTSNSILVELLPDQATEDDETVMLELLNPSGGAGLLEPMSTTLVIEDDDQVLYTMLYEPFDEPALPPGWTIGDQAGSGAVWRFGDPGARSNQTGGAGGFAIADSALYYRTNMDAVLVSPPLDLSMLQEATLSFNYDFNWYPWEQYEKGDIDISVNGVGGPWTTLLRLQGDGGSGPASVTIPLGLDGTSRSNVAVRFRYHDVYEELWWQLDDVSISGEVIGGNNDTDGDRIHDWWELVHFGGATNANPGAMAANGINNLLESFIAGINPDDPQARFALGGAVGLPPPAVTFTGVSDRVYDLWGSSNLLLNQWYPVFTNISGEGTMITLPIPSDSPVGAYRLDARMPEPMAP